MSSVTTIDPQPNNSDCNSAASANGNKASACCESVEHCNKKSPAKMEPKDSANRNEDLSGRRNWLSLAAVSAAITFMVAPLCVGAFQRPATTTTVPTAKSTVPTAKSTERAAHPNASGTTVSPNMAKDANHSGISSETSLVPPPRTAPPSIDTHTEKPFGTDYVALREPTEDGDRVRIVVFEPNRDIYIHESAQDGIQVRVRRYLFGTSTEQMVSASDIENLKDQSAEAFELYSNHIGKASLPGPTVSIYPAEEIAWLQPSGFLTAMSIDEAKSSAKKSSDKKKSASGKKENTKPRTAKKETMKKDSQKKEPAKKNATKKPTNSKAASTKDSAKPKPTKNAKKDNDGAGKKMSPKKEASKKEDSDNDTKKKSTPNKKDLKESSSKKSTPQRDAAMKPKSEKQTAKKAKTERTKSKVAKSSEEVPSKKSTARKEAKPNSKSKSESSKKSVLQRPLNNTTEMPQLATESSQAEVAKST